MQLSTKYFGQIDCDEADFLLFPQGLFGFEDEKSFLLMPFADSEGSLLCLQSTKTSGLAFVVMNPFSFKPDYAPKLESADLARLGVNRSEDLCFYVLCVVKNPVAESTVNLKCPVAINDSTRKAIQVILETGDYEMRHLLAEFGTKREG